MMNRQRKQLLLSRLESVVCRYMETDTKSCEDQDRKELIKNLRQSHDGKPFWYDIYDNRLYRKSRLIQTWDTMTMDLSI